MSTSSHKRKLPVIVGLAPLLDKQGRVVERTKEGALRIAKKMAGKGFVGTVVEGPIIDLVDDRSPQFYRIQFGAQKDHAIN